MELKDYQAVLKSFFPKGPPWVFSDGKVMTALVNALASEFYRFDLAMNQFLTEIDPGKTRDLLPEFERMTGVEHNPSIPLETLRQKVLDVLFFVSDQSIAYYTRLCREAGFLLAATEYQEAVAGCYAGALCVNSRFKFTLYFVLTPSPGGDGEKVKDEILRRKPAHIVILFQIL